MPDYDGRGEEPVTAGDVLLWVPRVILSPLYFVSEFVVRRPLGALATTVEENDWPGFLQDAFGSGAEGDWGVVPTGLFDYGLRASGGVYLWANNVLVPGQELRVRASTGGFGYVNVVVKERIPLAFREQVGFRGEYDVRSDSVFYGLGPESRSDPIRYRADRWDGKLAYETRLWRTSGFSAWLGARSVSFDGDVDGDGDPSLNEAVQSGRLPAAPPGFGDGYAVGVAGMRAALDTRPRRHADSLPQASDYVSPPASGVRLAARGEYAASLRDSTEWIAWGGTLAGYVDLDQEQRMLGLVLTADFADPIGDGEVPFTELASLGGARPLRGFLEGRMIDRSATALQLEYQYPIWVWLDGALHYAVGNAFGPWLEAFEPERLRSSFGMGFRSAGSRDHVFEVLVAFGTERFESGSEIESFRFVVGATSAF